jgi:hypothetical protein
MSNYKGNLPSRQDRSSKRTEVVLGLCSQMSKSEARTKLREVLLQNGGKPAPTLHDITFGEYWRDHYVALRRSGRAEPTEAGYKGYIKFLIFPALEHLAVKDNRSHFPGKLLLRLFDDKKNPHATQGDF